MPAEQRLLEKTDLKQRIEKELTGNILPFWMEHAVDRANGGFYGALTNDLTIHNEVPRSAILCARILWTYAAAYRRFPNEKYLAMARWAYAYLTGVFVDKEYGGVYWHVDAQGIPIVDRKHHYAQAFAIYGLSEYYRASGEAGSLALAQELFSLLEKHALDPLAGGYIEGSSRKWEALEDMRLSDKDLNSRKSMNTMLHMLEAYTNLLRVWPDAALKKQHQAILRTFREHIIDPSTHHFRLFFDDRWKSLLEHDSYGHDIEGSWLLVEAAEVQGDPRLLDEFRQTAVAIAAAVMQDGLEADGSIPYEGGPHGLVNDTKAWWVQAEAVVGFYNAYQISGEQRFAEAAARSWKYIEEKVIDHVHGDWFKDLRHDGTPDDASYKVGPWECPYHHARACLEMLHRLDNP